MSAILVGLLTFIITVAAPILVAIAIRIFKHDGEPPYQ